MKPSKIEDLELTEEQCMKLSRFRGGCSCHINPPCSNCVNPITEEEAEYLGFIEKQENTTAYVEYMSMADRLFEHIKNGTVENPEEKIETEKNQNILWEQMTEDERINADDTISRTVLYLKGNK